MNRTFEWGVAITTILSVLQRAESVLPGLSSHIPGLRRRPGRPLVPEPQGVTGRCWKRADQAPVGQKRQLNVRVFCWTVKSVRVPTPWAANPSPAHSHPLLEVAEGSCLHPLSILPDAVGRYAVADALYCGGVVDWGGLPSPTTCSGADPSATAMKSVRVVSPRAGSIRYVPPRSLEPTPREAIMTHPGVRCDRHPPPPPMEGKGPREGQRMAIGQ